MGDLLRAAFEYFGRLLRFVFPGLLAWALLPLALQPVDTCDPGTSIACLGHFYDGTSPLAQGGLIAVAGLALHLGGRYVIHEPFLGVVLFHWPKRIWWPWQMPWLRSFVGNSLAGPIGAATKYQDLPRGPARLYPLPTGPFLGQRFGPTQPGAPPGIGAARPA